MKTNNEVETIDKVRNLIIGQDLINITKRIASIEQTLSVENLKLKNEVRRLEHKIQAIEKNSINVEVGKFKRVIIKRKDLEQ